MHQFAFFKRSVMPQGSFASSQYRGISVATIIFIECTSEYTKNMSIGPPDDSRSVEKKSTTTMTFRIDSDIILQMKEKAEQEGITLNTLVSHVLKRYAEWDMYIENRAGIIPLTRPVAFELFKRLSRGEVVNLANDVGKKAVYEIALFMRGDINQISLVNWFLSRMKNSSASVSLINTNNGNRKTYIIKHDMGENWSLYHKTVLQAIFYDILQKPLHVGITESTLTLEFEVDETKK